MEDSEEKFELEDLQIDLPGWLQDAATDLIRRHHDGKLPHGLLLHGSPGIGKRLFAVHLARQLLCDSISLGDGQARACGQCRGCVQLISGNHPDYRCLRPVTDKKTGRPGHSILIDEVREFREWIYLTSHYQGLKVAIIDTAEHMTVAASNALLKTLEEPAGSTVLLLLANRPIALPATITSRCQQIRLLTPQRQEALDWLSGHNVENAETLLRISSNAPMRALEFHSGAFQSQREQLFTAFSGIVTGRASIAKSVDALRDYPTSLCLSLLTSWVSDILKCHAGSAQHSRNPDKIDTLQTLEGELDSADWFSIYDQLLELNRSDSASFKAQPVLESIFAAIRLLKMQSVRS